MAVIFRVPSAIFRPKVSDRSVIFVLQGADLGAGGVVFVYPGELVFEQRPLQVGDALPGHLRGEERRRALDRPWG